MDACRERLRPKARLCPGSRGRTDGQGEEGESPGLVTAWVWGKPWREGASRARVAGRGRAEPERGPSLALLGGLVPLPPSHLPCPHCAPGVGPRAGERPPRSPGHMSLPQTARDDLFQRVSPAPPAGAPKARTGCHSASSPCQHPVLPPTPRPRRAGAPAVPDAAEDTSVGDVGGRTFSRGGCGPGPSQRVTWLDQAAHGELCARPSQRWSLWGPFSTLCPSALLLPIRRVSREEPPRVRPRTRGASAPLCSQVPVPRSSLPSGNIQLWS